MARTDSCSRIVRAFLLFIVMLPLGLANAATLTFELGFSFGDPGDPDTQQPEGPAPWLTAVFDDGGSAGTVTLTMTASGGIGIADITGVYFNLDPDQALTFTYDGASTGPAATSIGQTADSYMPDGDGFFDILLSFANDDFMAGESVIYDIDDGGSNTLLASSFDFFSLPSIEPGATGPFQAAAKFQSTGTDANCAGGEGQCSDWVGTPPAVIPVPQAAWLFGSALGLLAWIRRRKAA
jgi:hypothetical protein